MAHIIISETILTPALENHRAISLTQWPFKLLFQKYATGVQLRFLVSTYSESQSLPRDKAGVVGWLRESGILRLLATKTYA